MSYPIDGATRVMFGRALTTDSLDFERRQVDWTGGVEVRMGHMRIYAGGRTSGSLIGRRGEIRLAYFF